jgi:hypothetical protein
MWVKVLLVEAFDFRINTLIDFVILCVKKTQVLIVVVAPTTAI